MKKIVYFTVLLYGVTVFLFNSCELFKIDNYDEPKETIKGEITDVVTGERVLTDQDNQGIRIRMNELSWKQTEVPSNFDINCMKEGEYLNTKIFKGHYNVRADGPFIPLVRVTQQGDTIMDESKYVDIKGVTVVNFQVQPFLRIEWVGEPVVNGNTVTVSFKIHRAVTPEAFRAKIEPMGGWNNNFLELSDVRMYVGESAYTGRRDNSSAYTFFETFSGNDFESKYGFGETITYTSNAIPRGRTVFVRIAARIRYSTEGTSRYNYNEAKRVDMPQ